MMSLALEAWTTLTRLHPFLPGGCPHGSCPLAMDVQRCVTPSSFHNVLYIVHAVLFQRDVHMGVAHGLWTCKGVLHLLLFTLFYKLSMLSSFRGMSTWELPIGYSRAKVLYNFFYSHCSIYCPGCQQCLWVAHVESTLMCIRSV